jgi:drug/metabolite transporter (DMT)-like permease
LLNAWALARADSSTVATYVYAQPPIAALAAFLLLDITPTVRALIASGIIALGVALANQRSQPAR